MQILFWGKEESFDSLSKEYLSNDELIEKCLLPEILRKRYEEVPETACVLILDGDYEYMFNVCVKLGYHITNIIDFPKYVLYKDLECLSSEKSLSLNGIETSELWYDILHKVIASYDSNGEVISACKLFFEKKMSAVTYDNFWT